MKILFALLLALPFGAWAYPSFIGYGYTTCMNCHFNPYGNGPLTDYGRAVSASTISGRPPFVSAKVTDEQLGDASGFLGPVVLPEWIRPGASYRGLLLASKIGKQDSAVQFYNMQVDANIVLRAPENRIFASATVGYAPNGGNVDAGNLISREHYLGSQINDNWGVYAGFMDIAYGIRVPDHEAYSRSRTGLTQNDQSHGVLVHYVSDKFEAGLEGFLGNLYQDSAIRPKGVSTTVEYEAWEKSRVGASFLYSKNDFRKRYMTGVHLRAGLQEGSAILAETGLIFEDTQVPSSKTSQYVFLQSLHRLFRGFHLLGNAEYYTDRMFQPATRSVRLGPGVQWFAFQRLEIRTELQGQWAFNSPLGNTFSLNWMGQAHLSF